MFPRPYVNDVKFEGGSFKGFPGKMKNPYYPEGGGGGGGGGTGLKPIHDWIQLVYRSYSYISWQPPMIVVGSK